MLSVPPIFLSFLRSFPISINFHLFPLCLYFSFLLNPADEIIFKIHWNSEEVYIFAGMNRGDDTLMKKITGTKGTVIQKRVPNNPTIRTVINESGKIVVNGLQTL
jgi:hypothetical protein